MASDLLPPLSSETEAWFILAAICGALLLTVGGVVFRLGLALAGLAVGSLIGWFLWSSFDLPVPEWLVLAASGIGGLCVALLAARLAIALLLGAILAVFFMGIVCAVGTFDRGLVEVPPPPTFLLAQQLRIATPTPDTDASGSDRSPPWYQFIWKRLSRPYQLALGVTAAAGVLVGIVVAVVAARTGTILMTTLWGGFLGLTAATGLAAGETPLGLWSSGIAMMLSWTAISAFGWAIQRPTARRRGAPPGVG